MGPAGYDFFTPVGFSLKPGEMILILRHKGQDRGRLGAQMLSEKRPQIQIPPSAQ